MRFLLDTNVVSELRKGDRADSGLTSWFETVDGEDLAIMTARAKPTRVRIFANPRMKCCSKPKLWSMRLLIRSKALRRL